MGQMSTTLFTTEKHVTAAARKKADRAKGAFLQHFFKTAPGEYAAGDIFWGLSVPETRAIAKQSIELPLSEVEKLLNSPVHELRLCAVFILVARYKKEPKNVFDLYVKNLHAINNWDIVDSSADRIIGNYLHNKPKTLLTKLAKSKNIWHRRVAMLSTFDYIKGGKPDEALKIAKLLLHDTEDLIHKAVGWMLREIGKRCSHECEVMFLEQHYKTMPRTMLRYAIEHFSKSEKAHFMAR